jgi:uncharacterized protein (UPF0335 family)
MSEQEPLGGPIGDNARAQLVSLVERVERLLEEASTLREDVKEVFAEAKSAGFDTKIMRKAIRIRAMDQAKRQEEESILDLYLKALGVT